MLRLLERPGPALVTVTGMPGIGKSALLEAVVAALPDPRATLVQARHLSQPGGLSSALQAHAHPAAVVAIDDVDRPPDGPDLVGSVLEASPGIRLLVTARSPLRLPHETVVRLGPLPRPDPGADPADLARDPAVRIFLRAAARTGTSAPLDGPALVAIARVCAALGGVPLAIELVASRAATYSPAALLDLVSRPSTLGMLHGEKGRNGDRDLLRALSWSQSLLSPAERALLEELSVFRSAAALGSLEAVCRAPDLPDTLSTLVDVHLVEPDHDDTTTRFSLPAVVRHHVWEGLVTHSPARARDVRSRHLRWATSVAQRALDLEADGRPTAALTALGASETDLEDALRWALETGEEVPDGPDTASSSAHPDPAVTLALGLLLLWFSRGTRPEHVELVDRVLPRTASDPVGRVLLEAWRALLFAELARSPEQVAATQPALRDAVERARPLGPRTTLQVLFLGMLSAMSLADRSEVEVWAAEGRELATRLGDQARLARFEGWTGMLAHQAGRIEDAARWGRQGLARARKLDDPSLFLTPAGLLRSLPPSEWTPAPGDPTVPTAGELVAVARRCRSPRSSAWLEPVAAMEALAAGDHAAAARYSTAALGRARSAEAWARSGPPLMCLSLVAMARGEVREAARLQGMVDALLPVLRPALPPAAARAFDGAVAALRAAAPTEVVTEAFQEGRSLSSPAAVEAAISYAARVRSQPPSPPREKPADPAAGPATSPDGGLTEREREVLQILVSGGTNKEISAELGISPKTVMHHTSSIYRKLQVRGRAQAVAWELRRREGGRQGVRAAHLRLVEAVSPGDPVTEEDPPPRSGQGRG